MAGAATGWFSAISIVTALYVQAAPCNFQWQAPERQYANEGGQFTVDCSFTANYQPSNYLYVIAWRNPLGLALELVLHNDNIIDNATLDQWNRQYTFIKPATVQLSAATAADAGNYTCKLQLNLGCDSPIIPDKQIQMVVRVPPSKPVITRHQSTGFTVREGDFPKLRCMSATGTPPLVYTWSRGSTSLTGTPDTANTFSILTIPSIQRSQQGPYQCSVQNAAGSITSDSVTLDVQYRAELHPTKVTVKEVAVDLGSVGLFTLYVVGNPKPTSSTWMRVNGSLPANAVPGHDIDNQMSTLTIPHLRGDDFGTYTCVVKNAAGERGFTFILEMRGKPDPPTDISALKVSAVSVTVQWTSNKNGGYEQKFTVQYKASGEDWQSITNIEDPGYKRRRSYKVRNLRADTQYRFRVESRNKGGSGGYSYELVVQTKSKPVIAESSLSVDVKGNIATIKWSLPEGEFAGYGIQYCVQGTNQCASHNITNVTVTSADITLPDGGHQYEFSLIVYQGDDVVVSSLHFKQVTQTAQVSFPVGVVVGVITAVVLVAVTGVFVFLCFSRRNRNRNNANRNDDMGRENVTNELSVIQSTEENNLYEKPSQAEETQPTYTVLKY